MYCKCGSDTIVKDSRTQAEGQWRKRKCKTCGEIFTTIEQLCKTLPAKRGKPFSDIRPVPRPKRERPPKTMVEMPKSDTAVAKPSARSRIESIQEERYLRSLDE